jgi:hypothetical protein
MARDRPLCGEPGDADTSKKVLLKMNTPNIAEGTEPSVVVRSDRSNGLSELEQVVLNPNAYEVIN